MKHRGFVIKTHDHNNRNKSGFVIYKDGSQYSIMHLASVDAAKRVIDNHLGKEVKKETVYIPSPEPENLNTVGAYSNKGYLSLMEI